jgi:hypothetical protein
MHAEPRKSSLLDHVGLDREVLVDEVGRVAVVGEDAADLGRGEEYRLGLFLREEIAHRARVDQVELGVAAGDEVAVALRLEPAQERRAGQAAVAGHKDARLGGHSRNS